MCIRDRLDTVLDKFLKTMQTTAARLQEKLLKPEARQKGKEQVKEKACLLYTSSLTLTTSRMPWTRAFRTRPTSSKQW